MDPLDALYSAIYAGDRFARRTGFALPGSVVAAMPQDTREALSHLTPAILATARCYPEDSQAVLRARDVSQMKRRFDARCTQRR